MSASKYGAVLLVTHTRVEQLNKVLRNLEKSWIPEYKKFFVIVHKNETKVMEVISKAKERSPIIVEVNRELISEPREAISRNIFDGLCIAFEDQNMEFVTVLEDDILVRQDFLRFNYQILEIESINHQFRGINGFSGAKFDELHDLDYGKFRFGFGWGWTVPRSTWETIKGNWSNNFDAHWDATIEKFVRNGYVVMPRNSRVFNLGFDETATHTSAGDLQEAKLLESYKEGFLDLDGKNFTQATFELNWRKDAIKYLDLKSLKGWISNLLWRLFNSLSSAPGSISLLFQIRAKLKGMILRILLLL